jgi:hypothetical protein
MYTDAVLINILLSAHANDEIKGVTQGGRLFYRSSFSRLRRASSASLGASSTNDPVLTSPAHSYEAMMTPLGES